MGSNEAQAKTKLSRVKASRGSAQMKPEFTVPTGVGAERSNSRTDEQGERAFSDREDEQAERADARRGRIAFARILAWGRVGGRVGVRVEGGGGGEGEGEGEGER